MKLAPLPTITARPCSPIAPITFMRCFKYWSGQRCLRLTRVEIQSSRTESPFSSRVSRILALVSALSAISCMISPWKRSNPNCLAILSATTRPPLPGSLETVITGMPSSFTAFCARIISHFFTCSSMIFSWLLRIIIPPFPVHILEILED